MKDDGCDNGLDSSNIFGRHRLIPIEFHKSCMQLSIPMILQQINLT